MKARLLLALLLAPALAHADALSAYGMGKAFEVILALGVTLLVALCFLIAMYSWSRWRGLPYLLGVPLLLLTWARLAAPDYDTYRYLTYLLLLALLLNGLVWGQAFRPLPIRLAGALAILIGSIGLVSTVLGFRVLPPYHKSSYAESAYAAEPAPLPEPPYCPPMMIDFIPTWRICPTGPPLSPLLSSGWCCRPRRSAGMCTCNSWSRKKAW